MQPDTGMRHQCVYPDENDTDYAGKGRKRIKSGVGEQSVDSIDNRVQIYINLINYLTYSSDLREIMEKEYRSDYEAYLAYTEIADPLFTVRSFIMRKSEVLPYTLKIFR